jgi:two-component system, NtrC family, response regulator AtoC
MASILIVDPEASRAKIVAQVLEGASHVHRHVATAAAALEELEANAHDLLVLAAPLDDDPRAFLERVGGRWPGLAVITVASGDPVANAEEALRLGATDSLTTPVVPEEVAFVVAKALSAAALEAAKPPRAPSRVSALLGESEPMVRLRDLLRRVAEGTSTTLVRGETGTGKELVARAVHAQSPRRDRPFVKIDCASLPDNLLESELFGYEKGAFTGAVARKPGRVELAEGGTLFLDEIGEISPALQAKLLRLIQDREFERLGSRVTQRIDTRFVLATHRDLETMIENGSFREDLFHRINVVTLWLPPLRARRDDVPLLAREFVARFCAAAGKPRFEIAAEALRALRSQRWPGNVRQLENLMERLVVLSDGPTLELTDVERELAPKPQFRTQHTETRGSLDEPEVPGELAEAVRRAERAALLAALERTGGNRSVAARVLGVSRATLYNKLREYGVE